MIKNIVTFVVITMVAQLSCAEDKILAEVNGRSVYETEIRDRVINYLEVNGDKVMSYDALELEVKAEIVKSIILGDIILDEARKAKINESKEYKDSLNLLKNQLLQKFFIEQLVKVETSEDKALKKYKQIITDYDSKYEYKVSHILVSDKAEAQEIKNKLNKGANFAKLSSEYSLDNKDVGGSLDYFSSGQMVEPFEQATSELKINEISDLVKTDFGYHIIKLENKRKMEVPSFEELKEKISEELSNQFIKEYIENLEAKNKVKFL